MTKEYNNLNREIKFKNFAHNKNVIIDCEWNMGCLNFVKNVELCVPIDN